MPGRIIDMCGLKENILSFKNTLIVTHINPDPDALGAALGLKWIFSKLGKTSRIFCDMAASEKNCGIFNIAPELDGVDMESESFDYIICVDAASRDMLGKTLERREIDLVIDHHYTNSLYGRETYLDAKAAAAGEIIFDLAEELGLEPEPDFAQCIYCAIVSDSGSFRYSSTTPKTMRAAAKLIETGFDFAKLNRLIFQNKSLKQVGFERLAYNSLEMYGGGRVALLNITRELKKEAGLEGFEIDGLNEIPLNITGVEVGVVIKEKETETEAGENNTREFKISLRSNDYVNVAEIAAHFGGGGHVHAAGCTFTAEPGIPEPAGYIARSLVEKIESVL